MANAQRRTWIAAILATAVLAVSLWLAADVLFMLFAGVLLAIGVDALACALARHTPLSRGWAAAIVLTVLLAALTAGAAATLPFVLDQLSELRTPYVEDVLGDSDYRRK